MIHASGEAEAKYALLQKEGVVGCGTERGPGYRASLVSYCRRRCINESGPACNQSQLLLASRPTAKQDCRLRHASSLKPKLSGLAEETF